MKTLLKVFAILAALVVVLLVAGSVLLKIYLPPEKAKKLVLEHLSTQLKREVELGSVSVSLLSGLQMTNLKISESPNFSKGQFLSSEQFSLKIALVPLLFRKVIVKQIVLKHPEVTVIRNADGKTFNFSDLTASTTSPSSTPLPGERAKGEGKPESLPFLLLVSRAEIQKGALHFVDRSAAHQSLEVSPFNLKLQSVSLTTPFGVQADLHVQSKGSDIGITFAGQANLLEGDFLIKEAMLLTQQSKLTVSGKVSGLKSSGPDVDLNVEIPRLNIANFKGFVALPPEARIEGFFTGHADLSGNEKTMNFSARLDGTNTKIHYGTMFSKPEKAPLTFSMGGMVKNLSEADIQTLKVVLGALTLSGHGKVQNLSGAQPTIAFHVESNDFPIEQVLAYAPGAVPAGLTLKGNNKLIADVSGTSAAMPFAVKWDGTGLTVAQGDAFAKAPGIPLDLSIIGQTAGPNKIIIKTMTAKLVSNQIVGSGQYETKGAQGNVTFTAKGTNWSMPDLAKVSPLLAPYHPTGVVSFDLRASGPASAPQAAIQTSADIALNDIKQEFFEGKNVQLKWNLTQITEDLSKVSGTASLKQGPGKILNVEKLAAGSRMGKIALAPLDALAKLQSKGLFKQVNLPSLQSIPFDSIIGDYLLRSGTMDIKTFNLNGRDLTVQNTGTVGLAGAQALNMKAVMKLAAGSIGGTLGNIIQDENGRPTVKYTITGTLSNPEAKIDLQETSKKAIQEVGKEIMKDPNVKNAVDDLQKSLKGIFH